MTEDAVISVVSAATRIACRQMTVQHLDALQASLEQASGLPARPDWGRWAAWPAEPGPPGPARPVLAPELTAPSGC